MVEEEAVAARPYVPECLTNKVIAESESLLVIQEGSGCCEESGSL